MKVTKTQLKQIIKEELTKALNENLYSYINRIVKILNELSSMGVEPQGGKLSFSSRPAGSGENWKRFKAKQMSSSDFSETTPASWTISRGKALIEAVPNVAGSMASEFQEQYPNFEPMLKSLGQNLISLGKSNPTPQDLETQLYKMRKEISSVRKIAAEILNTK
tara:strand:- start:328 stop:819 length:492 start_codon:yes stop_codon:yes gene_type:complete